MNTNTLYPLYADILSTVVENGRLILNTPEELEIEVEFEARERGLSEDEIKEAVWYAFDHFDLRGAREDDESEYCDE